MLVCVLASACCRARPPTIDPSAPAQRIALEHPLRRDVSLVSVDLARGDQIEWRAPTCGDREVTPYHWRALLEPKGFVVQDSLYNGVNAYGLRFRRSDGVYGDVYSDWSAGNGQICGNFVIRLQRSRVAGKPDPWKTRFSLGIPEDPDLWWPSDPSFPTTPPEKPPEVMQP